MPLPVSRMTDTGVGFCLCCGKDITVTIMIGIPTTLSGTLPCAVMSGLVLSDCGCVASITTGNPMVLKMNMMQTRVGDMFLGSNPICVGPIGIINIGLPTVLA